MSTSTDTSTNDTSTNDTSTTHTTTHTSTTTTTTTHTTNTSDSLVAPERPNDARYVRAYERCWRSLNAAADSDPGVTFLLTALRERGCAIDPHRHFECRECVADDVLAHFEFDGKVSWRCCWML